MKMVINSGDLFDKLPFQEACAAIRAAGFDAIDWSLDAEAEPACLEQQLSAILESGLHVAQASLSAPLFDKDDACGVTVCLENSLVVWHGYPYAGSGTYPEEAKALVDTLNEKAGQEIFGVCLNTGHLDLARSDFYAFLYKLGDRVKTLHINDNHGVYDDRILPMTGGVIHWDYVCHALRENGYRGEVVLDLSFAHYDRDMLGSALLLAADCARGLRRRIGEV